MTDDKNYKKCLKYIDNYWETLICYHPRDKQLHFGLPNRYIVPNTKIFNNDQFYWDSFFTIFGLVRSNKITLARGMVENLAFLFKRFGIIPMRNRYYNLGTSQIPFLTSMALEIFSAEKNIVWLKKIILAAEQELRNYWMNRQLTEKHIVHKGLSRYCDHYITHLGAEHESGWDVTSRFNNHCLDYLPVDLNSCLYKYETDLSHIFLLLKNYYKHRLYKQQAMKRKKNMNDLMWSPSKKFFFDYNYVQKKQSDFHAISGFYPIWAKWASRKQASLIVKHALPLLEHNGGIANTQSYNLSEEVKQHDYPNGWPPQQWIVIKGLLNYGFRKDAVRIAEKWLDMNVKVFSETGKLWEKYDVVNCDIGVQNPERYPTQSGFGWTNAIFVWLAKEFFLS